MTGSSNHLGYEWRHWTSADGLKLAARDYPGRADQPTIVCLAGLTRNSRDFGGLAERLAGEWRVVSVDFRGRGKSEYAKDPMTYLPPIYAADTIDMCEEFGLTKVVVIGTSLGGLVSMMIAGTEAAPLSMRPVPKIVGAVLNDVGPELDPSGLGRIRNYVGRGAAMPTWLHAARTLAEGQGHVYPNYEIEDWLAMAKRLYRLNSAGRIVLDYDMKIAEPFRALPEEAAPDLWPLFHVLDDVPLLVVRGALSDVLAEAVAERMTARAGAELVTVPGVGHAPTLDEPEAVAAVARLLAKVAEPANA